MGKHKASILIVEDDPGIVRVLQRNLVTQGYEVFVSECGERALALIEQQCPDLLLLDLGLPDMSGFEVCKRIRMRSDLPIIVLSVQDKERDKVQAFDLGADDYVAKPFGIAELLARIRVSLRHATKMANQFETIVRSGPLEVDFAQQLVTMHGKVVQLTPTEYALFKVFLTHRGKIITQQMLFSQVWGADQQKKSSYLHVYIGQLRKKIEPDPGHPRFFETISGVGYRFNAEVEAT